MAFNPAKSFQSMGRILRKKRPDVYQMGDDLIGGRMYFALKLNEENPAWSSGNGDDEDVAIRCAMLTPKGKEALQWVKTNCMGYRLDINDIPGLIKLSLGDARDIILFKTFWV